MKLIVKQAAILPVVIVLLAGCGSHEEVPIQKAPLKVSVQTIQPAPHQQQLTYSGSIEPENTAQIGFAVPGVVNDVMVQEGQLVHQGQLLASIDATEYSNALVIASSSLEQAEDMYQRLHELYQKGSLPEKDYIDIKTKVAQAQANKSINAKHIADSRLYAPMSGIVTARLIVKGSTAAPGIPAFTIVKADRVYASMAVPESEVGSLHSGMAATVFIPTLNDSMQGKISIINPQADAVSKAYTVKITLYNNHQRLLPGMIANMFINTGKPSQAVSIPATAVIRDADDITYVFVVTAQNRAIRRRIVAGNITGKEEILITDGLQFGERIITAGQTRLKDGDMVSY